MNQSVSIIVPVYNTAEYVEECILSILSQSYKNIELILVNDGSTDGSGDVCRKYAHIPIVKYLEQDNLGVTAARKRGVDEANGEWIMFVDSDDVITKDAVIIFLSKSKDVDIVVGINSSYTHDYPPQINRDDYLLMMYAKEVSSGPWAKFFRKQLFNEKTLCFNRNICRWEDWLMNLQIAKDNESMVNTISEQIYVYRMRSNSTSNTHILSFDELDTICKLADRIVCSDFINSAAIKKAKMKNRLKLFYHELLLNGFHNDPNHPFVYDIKHCLDEADIWKPIDRFVLSTSSPWAIKIIWNLRRMAKRLEHPSMILRDINKIFMKQQSL